LFAAVLFFAISAAKACLRQVFQAKHAGFEVVFIKREKNLSTMNFFFEKTIEKFIYLLRQ